MMTVPMDNTSAPSSRELVERLFKKNIELQNGLRKAAQTRIPSDPNAWLQMRENYEAIILEDHDFSEKHEIEFALWQLHYKKIEEYRHRFNAAKSAGPVTSQGGRSPARPDPIKKIRSAFKSFLSESTGFYHDLILKIRSKFGLPLGFFSEAPESQIIPTKDEKKSSEMKKGLLSCHRCLIYLGDLARYKGIYGEGDSVSREYAAASSYYIQAASLCPSSGNPHHQLAILASYSGDELVAVYRYFRSLAVDSPFLTARDNLIIAFEKNRQSFSQLPANAKATSVKTVATKSAGRGRGRGDTRLLAKDIKSETTPIKHQELSVPEVFKAFSTRFVRLNGVLFTRTSLETFGEIFSSMISDLLVLLSSGTEEELNFGRDAAENGLTIVRLIAILIFTVHNVKRESEGQTYAEILQRTVLLQNAFIAAFEFAGHIIKRCIQLHDTTSSYLLPAILVFVEWLACHPDIAAGFDVEEKQSSARSFFWNQCVSFMNKVMSSGLVIVEGDNDETCFSDMSQYDEGETGNRLALWEDFELRGFLPLVPAQLILDFSRKHSFGGDGNNKEKKARAQRIVAAFRVLMNVVQVDQQGIYFDAHLKKFVISVEAPAYEDYNHTDSDASKSRVTKQASPTHRTGKHGISKLSPVEHVVAQPNAQMYMDGEEEEEIVFKPVVAEKYPSLSASLTTAYETIQPVEVSSKDDWAGYSVPLSTPINNIQMSTVLHATSPLLTAAPNFSQQPLQHMNPNTSKWLMEQAYLSNGLKNLNISENGIFPNGLKNFNINKNGMLANQRRQEDFNSLSSTGFSPLISAPSNVEPVGQKTVTGAVIPSSFDSMSSFGATSGGLTMKLPPALQTQTASRKNPVSRPVRHLGPPPGFNQFPSKQLDDLIFDSTTNEQNPLIDDYSWLDGYQSSSTNGLRMDAAHMHSHVTGDNTNMSNDAMSFPFPGKQVSTMQDQVANENWQDFQLFEHVKPYAEQQLQQAHFKPSLIPEQHQAQSLWSSRYFV